MLCGQRPAAAQRLAHTAKHPQLPVRSQLLSSATPPPPRPQLEPHLMSDSLMGRISGNSDLMRSLQHRKGGGQVHGAQSVGGSARH